MPTPAEVAAARNPPTLVHVFFWFRRKLWDGGVRGCFRGGLEVRVVRLRIIFIALGVVVSIPVGLAAALLLYGYITYKPSDIVDFHPARFNAVASRPFFYSVGKELKYGSEIDERAPALLRGDFSEAEVSPDGEKIAVVADGVLKVVDRSGRDVETVAKVQSIFQEPKPYGEWFFRDGNIQWSPDSQSIYLIRDKYYHSKGGQLFSKYGQLWKYDLKTHALQLVLKPFPAGSYFFGCNHGIYFSVPTQGGDLHLEYFDGKTVSKIGTLNEYHIPVQSLQSKFKEQPFYSFSSWNLRYEFFSLAAHHVHSVYRSKPGFEDLMIGSQRYMRFSAASGGFDLSSAYCYDEDGRFLPGDRYFLISTHCGNYSGQLLIDIQSGLYMRMPKKTAVYLKANTDTDPHYQITSTGILPN